MARAVRGFSNVLHLYCVGNEYMKLGMCALGVVFFALLTLRGGRLQLPPEASEGYAVVNSHTCGSDDDKIRNVFEWVKERGSYIHPNVSTGALSPNSGVPDPKP